MNKSRNSCVIIKTWSRSNGKEDKNESRSVRRKRSWRMNIERKRIWCVSLFSSSFSLSSSFPMQESILPDSRRLWADLFLLFLPFRHTFQNKSLLILATLSNALS